MTVAILHDVVEDTNINNEDLINAGFSNSIISTIDCLTKRHQESYLNYIKRIYANLYAPFVKIADLEDNMSIQRALIRPDQLIKDFLRLNKYILTHRLLTGKITFDQYKEYYDTQISI